MTRVIFETATIADVVRKANRVAPTKGSSFDKAAGIVLDINPGTAAPVVVRATNLDVFSMEWVDAISVEGEPVSWRIPSQIFAQVIGGLPIGSDKHVTMEDKVTTSGFRKLHCTQNKLKSQFNLMDESFYPLWSAFDPDICQNIIDFGGKLTQVEWAAAKADPPLSGVHLDGLVAVCTDRYRLAQAALVIPHLTEPITVPAGILGQILKQTGEVGIGVDKGQLLIMPDEHTQIRAITFDTEYVKYSRIQRRDYPNFIKVKKTPLLEMMQRATNFAGNDRTPLLKCFIGKSQFAVMMSNEEVGLLGDVFDLVGQCQHDRLEVHFTPKNIMEAISHSPSEEVTIQYDATDRLSLFHIDGGSGYEAWVIPRRDIPGVSSHA